MFERFTEKAVKVIIDAQQEAKSLHHKEICSEHILIGIIRQKSGIASKFLKAAGISYEKTLTEVKKHLIDKVTPNTSEILPFSKELKKVLETSLKTALSFENNSILPEHIFLSLINVGNKNIEHIVEQFDIDLSRIESSITRVLQKKSVSVNHPEQVKTKQDQVGQRFSIASVFEEENTINLMNSVVESLKSSGKEAIGTEQLLLGVLENLPEDLNNILAGENINKETVYQKLYEENSRLDEYDSEYLYTPKALRVLGSAYETAKELGSSTVLPEHILIAILKEKTGLAYKIFRKLGLNPKELQKKILNPLEKESIAAVNIMKQAREEAKRLSHKTIGSELLLLGIMFEPNGIGYKVLSGLGVTVREARGEVEKIIGKGSYPDSKDFSLSVNAKKILDNAYLEAKNAKKDRIESEHFLTGIINEPDCVANKVLEALGVDAIEIKQGIKKYL